jgi:hypothetical protein
VRVKVIGGCDKLGVELRMGFGQLAKCFMGVGRCKASIREIDVVLGNSTQLECLGECE